MRLARRHLHAAIAAPLAAPDAGAAAQARRRAGEVRRGVAPPGAASS
jgi:hypothetical protein